MSNPFEDENATYRVLMNAEDQYCLWPSFADVPDGWRVVHDEDSREACLRYVEEHWTDMRPRSLVEAMERDAH